MNYYSSQHVQYGEDEVMISLQVGGSNLSRINIALMQSVTWDEETSDRSGL